MSMTINPTKTDSSIYIEWTCPCNDGSEVLFSIQKAKSEDALRIAKVVQEAYFDPNIFPPKDQSKKSNFSIDRTAKRISNPNNFTVLVCKAKRVTKESSANEKQSKVGSEEEIVGTIYLELGSPEYTVKEGGPTGKLGAFAILPYYQGQLAVAKSKFKQQPKIGAKLIECIEKIAEKDLKLGAIFLYAIGSRNECNKYDNHLPGYYEKLGYHFVANKIMPCQPGCLSPEGKPLTVVPEVLMAKHLGAQK